MKNSLAFLFILTLTNATAQIPGVFPRVYGRADSQGNGDGPWNGKPCETTIKVADEQPLNCSFSSPVFYPVFIENFDYKADLPLNFEFSYPYSDFDSKDYKTGSGSNTSETPCGITYLGNGYSNNIDVINGEAHLKVKKEQIYVQNINGCTGPNLYEFTASILHTLPRFKNGIFVAKLKLPKNPDFWPALWMFGTNPAKQEIDIFEHYDDNISGSNCDKYSQMKMTNHKHVVDPEDEHDVHCYRRGVFPTSSAFFDTDHIYQLTWTDYRVLIYLDNTLVGSATRYYDKPWYNSIGDCLWRPGNY